MQNLPRFILGAVAIGVIGATSAHAATKTFLFDQNQQLMNRANSGSKQMLMQQQKPGKFMGLGINSSLKTEMTLRDANGDTTVRYRQMYKGVPVAGDQVVIARHADGSFKRAHGAMMSGIEADVPSVTPAISAGEALSKAKMVSTRGILRSAIGEARQEGLNLAPRTNFVAPTFSVIKNELVIWQDKAGTAHLAYEISYFQEGNLPSRPHFYIDANSGKVLQEYNNLQTANATGPGGNIKTGKYFYNGSAAHGYLSVTQSGSTCTMDNTKVKSTNLNHGTTGTTAFSFTCPDNTFQAINGAYSPINDAHYFGGKIVDMFNAWWGGNPLTFKLNMRVHYKTNYENAFWNGSNMNFGDGASTFYPLTALDVAGHEVSHGFTEQHSALVYSGKSGGLNESFSDMVGESVENYVRGSNDWAIGKEIFKASGALRYMNNPPLDGQSIDNAANYTSGLNVHYSSGVYNKAFYNLATTAGWSTKKAFQVYARANANYWTANVNWNQAGNGAMDAACDLGFSTADVKASLTAVGVTASVSAGSSCASGGGGGGGGGGGTLVLTNGTPATGLSASTGSDVVYTMNVPAGATAISFSISGGTGDADMYVKFGSTPTDTSYDCRPYVAGNSETCSATSTGGTYYVRVKAYSTFSGVTLTGSYTPASGGGGGGGLPAINDTVNNISVSRNTWKRYTEVLVAGYANMTVSISGGTGDTDLYVTFGTQSTTTAYDCRPYKNGNNESCSFTAPAAGTWYIDLRGYATSSGVTLNVKATP